MNNTMYVYQQIELVMPPMLEITSCRVVEKTHDPYKFIEAFNLMSQVVSCEQISRIDIFPGYTVWNIAHIHGRKSV